MGPRLAESHDPALKPMPPLDAARSRHSLSNSMP
jgi:hypothetical protein